MRKGLLVFVLVAVLSFVAGASDTLDVYFINVGAGDAILIDCGDWEALLDAGRGYSAPNAAVIAVLEEHVDDGIIELAILSHPHADHYGGFEEVFEQYEVWEFWRSFDTVPDASGPTLERFLTSLTAEGLVPRQLGRGDRFVEGAIEWTVLGPAALITSPADENDNENSLVLLLTYGGVRFLFVGDIEDRGETALRNIDLPEGPFVLKVAHHGSDTSTSLSFLDWAQPDLAVISTKYETPPALTNLELKGIPSVMTSGSGTIQVSTDGDRIQMSSSTSSFSVEPSGTREAPEDPLGELHDVVISHIHYDGIVKRTESDEYVEIKNQGAITQELEGWRLIDVSEGYPVFVFPAFELQPGQTIRVYTNEIHLEWGSFSFGSRKAVWNNSTPDIAVLYDQTGVEVSRKSY